MNDRLCEEAGLEKAMDLWMWELDISDREELAELATQEGVVDLISPEANRQKATGRGWCSRA